MAQKLKDSFQIRTLVADLGITSAGDPVDDILGYCGQQIDGFMRDFPECQTLSESLLYIANRVGTIFEEVHSDEDLAQIRQCYIDQKEKGFLNLEEELTEDVFGLTIRRMNQDDWEQPYVSIIDCRGEKAARSYFTKWHEVAHLLVLTDQMRVSFKRTHASTSLKDPEEIMMDKIAGTFGFRPTKTEAYKDRELSFEIIDSLKQELCPEASQQSSLIGFVKMWPNPCILIRAEMEYNRDQKSKLQQHSFYFIEPPAPSLRAVQVTVNDAAREIDFAIHSNMRVPETSIIHRVFEEGLEYDEADEDLSWWETSAKGAIFSERHIRVKARSSWGGVEALILLTN